MLDMRNMFDLTTIQPAIKDKTINTPQLIISPSQSSIIFDKVRFQYVDGHDFFSELSFEVPTGKKIGIVGGSSTSISIL